MRIKEFWVMRYGPLNYREAIRLGNFNLIWGKNEEGKTLTIDALVKILLGKGAAGFDAIERVDERPEGYAVVERNGKEVKLPESGDLAVLSGLTPSEWRNIFVIRNSDLSIAQEGKFYTDVTDKLAGLRMKDIVQIVNALRDIGKITPSGVFRDVKGEKLKTRIENANELADRIEKLQKEIEENGFDEFEEKLVQINQEIGYIEREIESLDAAHKRERYEKGQELLKKLCDSYKKLKEMEVYSEVDERVWQEDERHIETLVLKQKKDTEEIEEKKKALQEIKDEIQKKDANIRVLKDSMVRLHERVDRDLEEYKEKRIQLVNREGKKEFFRSIKMISSALFVLSLIPAVLVHSLFFFIFPVILFVAAVFSALFEFKTVSLKSKLDEKMEGIKLTLADFGLSADSFKEASSRIEKLSNQYQRESEELNEIKRNADKLENAISLINKEIAEIAKEIEGLNKAIDEIKIRSGENTLEAYAEKLRAKRDLSQTLGESKLVLKSMFGINGGSLEENIEYWRTEIDRLSEYRDKAKNKVYSEQEKSKLEDKLNAMKAERDALMKEMQSLRKEMEDIEAGANRILGTEEYLYCNTSSDLRAISKALDDFVQKNEMLRKNALEAIRIFHGMEAEEKEKLSMLFDENNSPVSQYFSRITDGLYERVLFSQDEGKVQVVRNDGSLLDAEKLSGGAYDQLYLSIRIALGSKLLRDGKGFFIMDDPFVKADPERIRKQINILKEIAATGWQIIYFSAKGEMKDLLREDIENGLISYTEI